VPWSKAWTLGNTRWEEPHIASVQVVDECLTLVIRGLDTTTAIENKGPFIGLVPVKLAVGMRCQSHVHPGHRLRWCENGRVLLTSPTGIVNSVSIMAKAHGPFCSCDVTRVCSWRCEQIAVYSVVSKISYTDSHKPTAQSRLYISMSTYLDRDPLRRACPEWAEGLGRW
jgi:hypothetical protein